MEITVSKRFLRVPVNLTALRTNLLFLKTAHRFISLMPFIRKKTQMRFIMPTWRDYLGKTMTVTVEPECAFTPVFEDAMTPLTAEETVLRPQLHFTAERGWINDPNGLMLLRRTVSPFLPAQSLTADCGATCIGVTP